MPVELMLFEEERMLRFFSSPSSGSDRPGAQGHLGVRLSLLWPRLRTATRRLDSRELSAAALIGAPPLQDERFGILLLGKAVDLRFNGH